MIIGVSLSTITSVNAYNYNKNAFENTDELKIINHHLHRVGFLNQKSTILSSFRRKYVSVFK